MEHGILPSVRAEGSWYPTYVYRCTCGWIAEYNILPRIAQVIEEHDKEVQDEPSG